jgi:biopolymer transport protein ExbB/biopolymer transport protein TolQ
VDINLIEIWGHMGLPVRAVVIVLTVQAIACISVILERLLLLARSRSRTRNFVVEASRPGAFGAERLLALAEQNQASHLASFLAKGLQSYLELSRQGQPAARAAELSRRALERKTEPLSRDLNRGMNVLASTGSTAPFVGLLGTVLGIMHAFKLIQAGGSGGIATIGPAIAEALIVTGYGLTVAIPVVLVFNYISGKLAGYEGDILNAAGDLLDRLEIGGDMFDKGSTSPREEAARVLATSPST